MVSINTSDIVNNLDIKTYYCGTQKCPPNHSWGPAIKEHFKIHYIHEGKGIFKTEGKTYFLEKGHGFLICPNVISYYEADSDHPWHYSWCAFDGLKADSYLSRANLNSENPIFIYNKDDAMDKCFNEMVESVANEKSNDLRLQSLLYLFFAVLIDEAPAKNTDIISSKDIYINKITEFVQLNYSHKIRISDLAKYIGLDRKYMSSLFKTATGVTLQDYLINFRLNKAKELMPNNALSIGDIARSVGYPDPLVFSKIFKKLNNVSPKEFREYKND